MNLRYFREKPVMLRCLLPIIFLFLPGERTFAQSALALHTSSEKDLIPEGIAVDARNGNIYISSIAKHKIMVMDSGGKWRNFIAPGANGFLEGLGMKVDTSRNLLWAISVKAGPDKYKSQVHAFNLRSGKEVQHYVLSDTVPHMFNDLDIDKEGNLYITDTYYNAIYHIDTKTKNLSLFSNAPVLQSPNGIAIGKGKLYIATYGKGLVQVDLLNKTAALLTGYAKPEIAHGLDGLVYSNGSLAGIYNYSIGKQSFDTALVVRYTLNEEGNAIRGEEIMDRNHPLFVQPTTAAVSGNKLFVLANSHLGMYNKNKQSTKGIEKDLKPVVVIRYPLAD
jgi:streptogramin lyase